MERRRVGKITVSLTLIGLGLALLFRNSLNLESIYKLYLPAVLIVLGAEIIISKYYYHRKGYDTRVEPLIIPLIILMLVVFVFGVSIEILDKGFEINLFNGLKYRNSTSISGEMLIEPEEQLGLDMKYVEIELVEADTTDIEVYADIKYRYNDSDKENLGLDTFLSEIRSKDRVDLVYDKSQVEDQYDIAVEKVLYKIKVPKKTKALYLDTMYTDIRASKLEADILADSFRYGNIKMSDMVGNIDFKASYSDLVILGLKGDVNLESKYSQVELYEIEGSVDFDISYSDILVENKRATIRDITGLGSYADINIDTENNQNAIYDLSVSFGDIYADGLSLDSTGELTDKVLKGTVGKGERKISISGKYSDIDIE